MREELKGSQAFLEYMMTKADENGQVNYFDIYNDFGKGNSVAISSAISVLMEKGLLKQLNRNNFLITTKAYDYLNELKQQQQDRLYPKPKDIIGYVITFVLGSLGTIIVELILLA